jgi:hypothetical protein
MLRTMNEAAVALMVSVGHRTGLFDVMAAMPAATSGQIASRAGLDERYVREWLAVMTTGRVVEHDGAAGTYRLPAAHAAWLTRAAGMNNLATGMQYIGLMALVERPDRGLFPARRRGPVLGLPAVYGHHGRGQRRRSRRHLDRRDAAAGTGADRPAPAGHPPRR